MQIVKSAGLHMCRLLHFLAVLGLAFEFDVVRRLPDRESRRGAAAECEEIVECFQLLLAEHGNSVQVSMLHRERH